MARINDISEAYGTSINEYKGDINDLRVTLQYLETQLANDLGCPFPQVNFFHIDNPSNFTRDTSSKPKLISDRTWVVGFAILLNESEAAQHILRYKVYITRHENGNLFFRIGETGEGHTKGNTKGLAAEIAKLAVEALQGLVINEREPKEILIGY